MTTILLRQSSLLLLLTAALLSGTGCKKEEASAAEKLPGVTTEGKNTFGCQIDNKVWLPYTDEPVRYAKLAAHCDNSSFWVYAKQHTTGGEYNTLGLNVTTSIMQPGTYLSNKGFGAGYIIYQKDGTRPVAYYTDGTTTGSITITKVQPYTKMVNDTLRHYNIVSGTFAFTAATFDGKRIEVKDGRFDVQAF